MLKQKKPKKEGKVRVVSSLPIARYAGDVKTCVIWNRMGYGK